MQINLTDKQKSAVEHINGPAILLSAPGTGKTTIILERWKHLIHVEKISPKDVIIISNNFLPDFENENDQKLLQLFRFKSFFKQFLIDSGLLCEHKSEIFTKNKQSKIINDVVLGLNIFMDEKQADCVINAINLLKTKLDLSKENALICFNKAKKSWESQQMFYKKKIKLSLIEFSDFWNIFTTYQAKLNDDNFDSFEIFHKSYNALQKRPSELEKFRDKYFLIDEFQDVTEIQWELIKKMHEFTNNILVVGDKNQSISLFSGAIKAPFKRFEELTKSSKKFTFYKNFRIRGNILNAINKLFQTSLSSDNKQDAIFEHHTKESIVEEAKFIADKIVELKSQHEEPIKIAILNRINYDSKSITEKIEAYNSKIKIKKLFINNGNVDYLKLIISFLYIWSFNLESKEFKQYIYDFWADREEKFDLKKRQFDIFNKHAKQEGKFDLQIFNNPSKSFNFSGAEINSSKNFFQLITRLQNCKEEINVIKLVESLWNSAQLTDFPARFSDIDKNVKYMIQQEIKGFFSKDSSYKTKESIFNLTNSFYSRRLSSLNSKLSNNKEEEIYSLTIHQSQGYEFDYVFICGLVENNIPFYCSLFPEEKEEEIFDEKKIFYIAMSRAKQGLFLISSPRWSEDNNQISRFVKTIEIT